jgi:hypothetical protein
MEVIASKGNERVDGRPKPGKDVTKTLRIDGAIVRGRYSGR